MAGGQFGFSTEVIPTETATPPEFSRAAEQLAEQGFAVSNPSPKKPPAGRYCPPSPRCAEHTRRLRGDRPGPEGA